jgi:broad specificity phosphatase PhoE
LFLIRHGEPESAWGDPGGDPSLSAKGHAQAAAARLGAHGPLAAISSPMRRCQETAAPFLFGASATIEQRVSEVATPGDVADRRAWLRRNFPWQDAEARRTWEELDITMREWRERVLAALREIETDAAIFTHFIAINAIVGAAINRRDTIVCRPDHASITEVEMRDGKLHLLRLGVQMSVGDVL